MLLLGSYNLCLKTKKRRRELNYLKNICRLKMTFYYETKKCISFEIAVTSLHRIMFVTVLEFLAVNNSYIINCFVFSSNENLQEREFS